ncbi:hypothetical protein OKW38_002668 [Paraburkholderia sp. MM5496-R1]
MTLASGKRPSANRARQALKMAAMSLSRSDSALGAFYRRLCSRMDTPRANTAVAHKLARMVYFMLTRGEAFVDQGQQRYEEQQRQRSIAALRRRASALGFQLQPNADCSPGRCALANELNGHEPHAYLKDIGTRPPTHRASDIAALLPHNWQPLTAVA